MGSAHFRRIALSLCLGLTACSSGVRATCDQNESPVPVEPPNRAKLVDPGQCPRLQGLYVNRELHFEFPLVVERLSNGMMKISIQDKVLVVNGRRQIFANGSDATSTCQNGQIEILGTESSGRSYHNRIRATPDGALMANVDAEDPSRVLNQLEFKFSPPAR